MTPWQSRLTLHARVAQVPLACQEGLRLMVLGHPWAFPRMDPFQATRSAKSSESPARERRGRVCTPHTCYILGKLVYVNICQHT